MPFTTKEIVKKHILDRRLGQDTIESESLRLTGTEAVQLQRRMLLPDSEKVKAKEQNQPTMEEISLAGGDTASLSHSELVPDTVVVASDSSLGTIYTENVDYHVDYDDGSIRRIDTGSIPSGADIVAWYLFYRVYQRGVDYQIDYEQGTVKRLSSGDIESGQWVLIDYTSESGGVDDETIDNAILEANNQVLSFIDSTYHQSSERSLVVGETYLAVSIICRIRAMESVSSHTGTGRGEQARSWIALSNEYSRQAYELMSGFAARKGTFKAPSKA